MFLEITKIGTNYKKKINRLSPKSFTAVYRRENIPTRRSATRRADRYCTINKYCKIYLDLWNNLEIREIKRARLALKKC